MPFTLDPTPERAASRGGRAGDPGARATATIGACVQIPGYDLARLSRDVVYLDNGRPLDTTMLPLPPIASSLTVR